MTTPTTEQTIYEITFGNLKALEFSTADEVLSKLDDIRAKMKIDIEPTGFSLWGCPVQERFEEIYDIAPYQLINLLGN